MWREGLDTYGRTSGIGSAASTIQQLCGRDQCARDHRVRERGGANGTAKGLAKQLQGRNPVQGSRKIQLLSRGAKALSSLGGGGGRNQFSVFHCSRRLGR